MENKEKRTLNPIDDRMFSKMAEEISFCEEIIRVILGKPDLEVLEVRPQDAVVNLQGRSVQLDVLCKLEDGTLLNVEVQKYKYENHQRRVRYYGSALTTNFTPKSTDFKDIPNVCIIYIAKFDIFGEGKSVYHVDRTLRENGERVYNGFEEIYVNAEARDGTDVSELMEVFTEDPAYNDKFPVTSELKKRYKDGDEDMIYTLSDELRDEGYAQGHKDGLKEGHELGLTEGAENNRNELVQSMIQFGLDLDSIAKIAKISIDQVREIQATAE